MRTKPIPAYFSLLDNNELSYRISKLQEIMKCCRLCPRKCNVDRQAGSVGYCKAGMQLCVASSFPHFGEEAPLVGRNGSGTIFFSHCNLRCSFCQNYEISHFGDGTTITSKDLAALMIELQKFGCHNINFVTPTHYAPQIISALPLAIDMGFNLPIVYNCGGYESIEVIQLLDGIIDIYMPDAKFSNTISAKKYMNASDYFEILKPVLKEMHRQVGILKMDDDRIAYCGLLIRHLIMPNNVSGSAEIFTFIAEELSKDSYINIMDQYQPKFEAIKDNIISRSIKSTEFESAVNLAKQIGLHNGFI